MTSSARMPRRSRRSNPAGRARRSAWKNPDSGHYGSIVPGPHLRQRRHQVPAVHPHHLYRQQAGDRARRSLPQRERPLDAGRLTHSR